MTSRVTMRAMLEAGCHFGHQTRFGNPKMVEEFAYGKRNKIHIINLERTVPLMNEALVFAEQLAARRGRLLFVGTKRAASDIIEAQAKRCGMPYVNHRWLGGMLTNYKTVRQSIKRLKELDQLFASDAINLRPKKEILSLERQRIKLERGLGGIKEMGGIPDAILVIDIGFEKIAVAEAKRLGLKVIGVVDTNYDPDQVDYVIPGNDDSMSAIKLYANAFADAVLRGKESAAPVRAHDKNASAEEAAKGE